MTQKRWISLKQAAAELDVHPTTLRRWADAGRIGVMLTPGGHRRFDRQEIVNFANSQSVRRTEEVKSVWAANAIQHTRQGMSTRPRASWMQSQSDETRIQYRSLGQRLVGLAMQYMASNDADESFLQQAQEIGRQYGQVSLDSDLSLTDALRASMFFHEQLLESSLDLPENARVSPDTNRRILRRINQLLNTIHLAIASTYEQELTVEHKLSLPPQPTNL